MKVPRSSSIIGRQSERTIMVAGKYVIDRNIGRGSFGEVFKGYDKDNKMPVAVKIVRLHFCIKKIQLFNRR